jgi:hypothetical protein
MSSTSTVTATIVSAEDVRNWANKRGFNIAPFGRLSSEVIAAFNKAHKAKQYVVTRHQPVRVVTVAGQRYNKKTKRNHKVVVTTTYPAVRKWAAAAGFDLGVRGRIPAEVMSAYANREAKLV